jgi:hypothetical protein
LWAASRRKAWLVKSVLREVLEEVYDEEAGYDAEEADKIITVLEKHLDAYWDVRPSVAPDDPIR